MRDRGIGGALLTGLVLACGPAPAMAQGTVMPGAGPVNASMAGTSVAAPIAFRVGVASLGEPITDEVTAFNLGSPGVMNPYLSFGASWAVLDRLRIDVGYFRIFSQSIEGPFLTPAGSIPGTRIETSASVDSFQLGFSARF